MPVTIRLFARLREVAGTGELTRELPADATVSGLWDQMVRDYPAMAAYKPSLSCAVNAEYARFKSPIADGDEIAFLPPVSGG